MGDSDKHQSLRIIALDEYPSCLSDVQTIQTQSTENYIYQLIPHNIFYSSFLFQEIAPLIY